MINLTKTVAFHTLGCKLNFSETSTIARNLKDHGYQKVEFTDSADVYVINTCSVTANADKECRTIVKNALKANPDGFVVVVGCYAQLKPEEIAQMEGVDLVLGAAEKFNVAQYLENLNKQDEAIIHSCEIEEADFYVGSYSIGDRTRAFLKVQDGCDYKCTYCTIPLARGISRSDTMNNVLKNAREIAEKGIKEIVLTGVNIGDYGKGEFGNKKHEHTFLELVQELDKVDNIDRIRISSIEPNLLKNETIEFVSKSDRFVPHFHIPLQSGSDTILKKMKRRYLSGLYLDRVTKIREVIKMANRLKIPNDWCNYGTIAAKEHMKAGLFNKMTPSKKVTFIERIYKSSIGLEGLEIVVESDRNCNGLKEDHIKFADIGNKLMTTINGNYIKEKYNLEEGIKIKEKMHQERVNWLKDNIK